MVLPKITTTTTTKGDSHNDITISNSTDKDMVICMLSDEKELYVKKVHALENELEDMKSDLEFAKQHSEYQLRNKQQCGRRPSMTSFKPGQEFKEDQTNLVYINMQCIVFFYHQIQT